jgi:hypothetical protein
VPKHTVGFVYVLSNPAMPGMVKVGRTRKLTESRAKELQTTGVPVACSVEFRALTSMPEAVEAATHEILAEFRVSSRREFFHVTPRVAIDAVRNALPQTAGLNAWEGNEEYMIADRDRVALTLEAHDLIAVFSRPHLTARTTDLVDLWLAHAHGDLLDRQLDPVPSPHPGLSRGGIPVTASNLRRCRTS